MHKSQRRNMRRVKHLDSTTSPKDHTTSTTELQVTETGTMTGRYFKSLLLKMMCGLKKDMKSDEVNVLPRKKDQHQRGKVTKRTNKTSSIEEWFAKKLRFFLNKAQMQILYMKISKNQTKSIVECLASRVDQAKARLRVDKSKHP